MNPFVKLQSQLRNSRQGNLAADALKYLAPHWEADWTDTGKHAKTDVLAVIDALPPSRLKGEMTKLVNNLPL